MDTLEGKILRIIPDLDEHVAMSTLSENGRYRIPNDNPFVATPGARKEIWAYGFRNPHRLNWAVDPANPANHRLIVNSVGLSTWESRADVRFSIDASGELCLYSKGDGMIRQGVAATGC